jgi:Circularly permutated YpsA SLOG family
MKIISGGQTGVDRAGLDAARELGLEYGGAVPRGRLAENGKLSPKYSGMSETESPGYRHRTLKNIRDSDATLIFYLGKITGGTKLTRWGTRWIGRPSLLIDLQKLDEEDSVRRIQRWLQKVHPKILNIAGSRESIAPGIYKKTYRILLRSLSDPD